MMRTTYSPDSDTLSVDAEGVTPRRPITTEDLGDGVLLDRDRDGRVLGLEILEASRFYPTQWLRSLGDPTVWLTLRDAADESEREGDAISASRLRDLLNDGTIDGRKVGRDWQIALDTLWNYLESRKPAGRPPAYTSSAEKVAEPPRAVHSEWGGAFQSPLGRKAEKTMARKSMNEQTSKRVASKASKLLRGSTSKTVKSVAGSALTQAPKKKK